MKETNELEENDVPETDDIEPPLWRTVQIESGKIRWERVDDATYLRIYKEMCRAWGPKHERQEICAFTLAELAMDPELSRWESNFVRSISHRQKLSPKQQEIIDRLVRQYLDAPNFNSSEQQPTTTKRKN